MNEDKPMVEDPLAEPTAEELEAAAALAGNSHAEVPPSLLGEREVVSLLAADDAKAADDRLLQSAWSRIETRIPRVEAERRNVPSVEVSSIGGPGRTVRQRVRPGWYAAAAALIATVAAAWWFAQAPLVERPGTRDQASNEVLHRRAIEVLARPAPTHALRVSRLDTLQLLADAERKRLLEAMGDG